MHRFRHKQEIKIKTSIIKLIRRQLSNQSLKIKLKILRFESKIQQYREKENSEFGRRSALDLNQKLNKKQGFSN